MSKQMDQTNYDRQRFGKAVRRFRGDTPAGQFAAEVKLSPAVLSRIERGKIVHQHQAEQVAQAIGVSLADFPAGRAGKHDRD